MESLLVELHRGGEKDIIRKSVCSLPSGLIVVWGGNLWRRADMFLQIGMALSFKLSATLHTILAHSCLDCVIDCFWMMMMIHQTTATLPNKNSKLHSTRRSNPQRFLFQNLNDSRMLDISLTLKFSKKWYENVTSVSIPVFE